jgi:hypothetical protein
VAGRDRRSDEVQQELMRHASIQTNVYGQAVSSSNREANGKVVEMLLNPLLRAPEIGTSSYWEFMGVRLKSPILESA